jgi:hypothetical protein
MGRMCTFSCVSCSWRGYQRSRENIVEETQTRQGECLGTFPSLRPISSSLTSDASRLGRSMGCNRVCVPFPRLYWQAHIIPDRSSLLPSSFELHTHLAHSLVRYLNLVSPSDLQEFGFSCAGDLVDITSRVNSLKLLLDPMALLILLHGSLSQTRLR